MKYVEKSVPDTIEAMWAASREVVGAMDHPDAEPEYFTAEFVSTRIAR